MKTYGLTLSEAATLTYSRRRGEDALLYSDALTLGEEISPNGGFLAQLLAYEIKLYGKQESVANPEFYLFTDLIKSPTDKSERLVWRRDVVVGVVPRGKTDVVWLDEE